MTSGVVPAALPRDVAANPCLARWVRVGRDGEIGLRVGKVELGQGIWTALSQVAADELDVRMDQVRVLPAHTRDGPDEGLTAGSMSVFDAVPAVRVVTASVRALFVAEAARRWGVDPSTVSVVAGEIRSYDGRHRTSYGDLADHVDLDRDLDADTAAAPKDPSALRLVGTPVPRVDLPDKVAGRAVYLSDVRLPGQLFGRVVRPPSPGAVLVAADDRLPGSPAVTVVRDGSFLGVVGPDEAEVVRAAGTLAASSTWDERDSLPDEADLPAFLRRGPHEDTVVLDEEQARTAGDRRLSARYTRPFLAHASIGTSCGIARWDDGRVAVWSHSQGIHRLRDAVATALEVPSEDVVVEHVQNAGCYGHNAADDAAFDAVLLSRAVPGRPVLVQWTRQDELGWAPFGSAMLGEVSATLSDDGQITSWIYDVYSQGHTARPGYAGVPGLLAGGYLEHPLPTPPAADPPPAGGGGTTRNAVPIYDVGARRVTGHRLLTNPVRSSALRALGAHLNVFGIECFMDELAAECGADPLEFRLRHLEDPRGREVLQAVCHEAGWGRSVPDGVGLGLGFARYKERGAYCAVVAEVETGSSVRVRRLTLAVDVGRVVNPDGVRNQIEGGAVQATSWTLKERVRFDRRRITSVDWESYPILRFSETPLVDVHILDRPDVSSSGAGEAAQGPTSAAIGNAVAAALGVRVRDLPITSEAVVAAIESQP